MPDKLSEAIQEVEYLLLMTKDALARLNEMQAEFPQDLLMNYETNKSKYNKRISALQTLVDFAQSHTQNPGEVRKILKELYYNGYDAGQQVGNDQEDMDNPEDIDQAEAQLSKLMGRKVTVGEIEKILEKIEIPIDTNPMYVEETDNPAIIKLKNTYGTIIAKAIAAKINGE